MTNWFGNSVENPMSGKQEYEKGFFFGLLCNLRVWAETKGRRYSWLDWLSIGPLLTFII